MLKKMQKMKPKKQNIRVAKQDNIPCSKSVRQQIILNLCFI